MSFSDSNPISIPAEARKHLQKHGDQLMHQLDAIRELEAERIEIEPLDADAQLSLRSHGDRLLADLDAQRRELATPLTRRIRFPWVAVAACFGGVIACTWLLDTPDPEPPLTVQKHTATDPEATADSEIPSPAASVPEPSTSLLALAGVMLLLRRRRD